MHLIIRDNIENYLDRRLPADVRQSVEAHLEGCAECRQVLEDTRQTSLWLKALAAEDAPEPAAGFYLKVRQRIDSDSGFSFWGMLAPAFRQLVFAALMLAVLLGGYYFALESSEYRNTTAELMLDVPVERETPPLLADHHANQERVMVAIAMPEGD